MRNTTHIPKPGIAPRSTTPLPPPVFAITPDAVRVVRGYVGKRVPWCGTVIAVGGKTPMLGLANVTDATGVVVWESLWLNYTQFLRTLDFAEGDLVAFVARVDKLLDGSYVLNRPLQVQRVET